MARKIGKRKKPKGSAFKTTVSKTSIPSEGFRKRSASVELKPGATPQQRGLFASIAAEKTGISEQEIIRLQPDESLVKGRTEQNLQLNRRKLRLRRKQK